MAVQIVLNLNLSSELSEYDRAELPKLIQILKQADAGQPLSDYKVNDPLPYAAAAQMMAVVPEWDTLAPMEAPRSGKWPRLAKIHLALQPDCQVCGTKLLCVPHHIKPFHIIPELELDPDNLITLCPPHHLLFGHLMNWRAYNPHVVDDCSIWSRTIESRPMAITAAHEVIHSPTNKGQVAQESEVKCDALFLAHPEIV